MAIEPVFKNNATIDAEEAAAQQAASAAQTPLTLGLSRYISDCWEQAQTHRGKEITNELLKCQRQCAGEYEPSKLADIQKYGGSDLYFNITESKTEGLKSWLEDAFQDQLWGVSPTPLPALPDDEEAQLLTDMISEYDDGAPLPPDLADVVLDRYDERLQALQQEAKARAERMEKKMQDQLLEGRFLEALTDFASDFAEYPTGFLTKAVRRKKRLTWTQDSQGEWLPGVKHEEIPTWYAISPHDAFPGPNARHLQDGYFCERVEWSLSELADLREEEGYSATEIDAVLAEHRQGTPLDPESSGESTREDLEHRHAASGDKAPDDTVVGVKFSGSVSGQMLIEWGKKDIKQDDENKYFDILAVLIGKHVVKAILNPHPLGERPVYGSSFVCVRNSVWGRSPAQKMRDCQDGMNATVRNLVNNIAMCGGPQVAADNHAIAPECNVNHIWPRKVWLYDGDKTQNREPVKFHQPDCYAAELLQVAAFFEKESDDRTGVPRFMYGDQDVSGAGKTASGLSMLMGAASKRMKKLLHNIDLDILRPALTDLYVWNMLYLPNDEYSDLKGDCQIVPKGIMALLHKEQLQLRRQEALDRTNNATDLQIIGVEGRAKLLRSVFQALELDNDIVPDDEELRKRTAQSLEGQIPAELDPRIPLTPEEQELLTVGAQPNPQPEQEI